MKYKLLLTVAFAINTLAVLSQNAQEALKEIWREKTEWRQRAVTGNANREPDQLRSANDSNIIVSATADIQSEVHAAINPLDSSTIVVSSNFVNTTALFPSQTNYIYYTGNFGQSWQKSGFVTGPGQSSSYVLGGGDPNFVFDDHGKAYFSWINLWATSTFSNTYFNLYWASSVDGGNTWQRDSTSDIIGSAPSSLTGTGGAFDKEWLAIDKNPSSPYYGNLYCSFFQVDANTGAAFIGVRKKAATGIFDTTSAQVNTGIYKTIQFASSAVDRNGGVHISFFASIDSIQYSLYHAVSNDGGVTFQPEVKISDISIARFSGGVQTDTIAGVSATRLYPSAYIACDATGGPHNNSLYMVWTANGITSQLNTGNDVYISISTNGGTTWSAARILNDNTANLTSDQYYPNITISPAGRVAITWWDRRDDSLNLKSNIYFTYSDDGGQTFVQNRKVTSQYTNFSSVGTLNGGFGIGEYNAVLATANYIIPVWADGRANNGQLNLYAAFINTTEAFPSGIQSISAINGPLKINSLFPDPAHDLLNLSYQSTEAGKMQLSVFDASGKATQLSNADVVADAGTVTLNINNLAPGTYMLKAEFNGTINVRQFVKIK